MTLRSFAKMLVHGVLKLSAIKNEDAFACHPNELLVTEPSKSSGERFARDVQFGRNNAFGMLEPDLDWRPFY